MEEQREKETSEAEKEFLVEGVDYKTLPGGYKYRPTNQRDPHDHSKPIPR